jgi:hypothetical protein
VKRDLDLARTILRDIEAAPTAHGWIDLEIGGHSDEEVSYHVRLLTKEGLIEASDLSSSDGFVWKPIRLTWAGHEFLDASRDESRWTKAKDIVLKKGGGLTFEVLKAVLIDLMKSAVL